MSLDIYLNRKVWTSYNQGKSWSESTEMVYHGNITHNLGDMAAEARIYETLWRPEKIGKKKAGEIIKALEAALKDLQEAPDYFKKFDSPNAWGLYDNFVPFVKEYLEACKKYPEATIEVSR